ncbi:MAG: hypothetical protein JXA30_07510 [Deltaproteobacteria bacterium]|nr:hypothetical protein [Deltaproteobacteria bacterium]
MLAVPDGCRWKRTKRSGSESAKLYVSSGSTQGPKDPSTPARGQKPVLRDELAAVVAKQQYFPEQLHFAGRNSPYRDRLLLLSLHGGL